jgi:hypothetical protein
MINVTPEARSRLAEALDTIDSPDAVDACFRLVPTEQNQLAMALAEPEEGDVTIEEDGKTVLALPPQIADLCDGRTLDVENGPDGQTSLTLR